MIGTLGSILTRVVTKIPKQCCLVRELSQHIGVTAKFRADATAAGLFNEPRLGGDQSGACTICDQVKLRSSRLIGTDCEGVRWVMWSGARGSV